MSQEEYDGSAGRQCDPNENDDPCEDECGCEDDNQTTSPVKFSTGTINMVEVDVSAGISGFTHSRVLRNTIVAKGNYDGPNGYNWDVAEWPYLIRRRLGAKITINARIGSTQIRFDKVGNDYVARHSKKDRYALSHDASSSQFIFAHHTKSGVETIYFHDFDQTSYPLGLMAKRVTARGDLIEVGAYTSDGNIANLVTTRGDAGNESYYELAYAYHSSGPHDKRINHVTLNQLDQYPSPTTVSSLRRSRYEYYDGSTTEGNLNDLKAAIQQKYVSGGTPDWVDINVSYYRYYLTNSKPNRSYKHGLSYAVGPAAYSELLEAGQDPLLGPSGYPSGGDLVPDYADNYFEYDLSHRVCREVARGCASCGSSGGTSNAGETFSRFKNPRYPSRSIANSDFRYNTWYTKTISTNHPGHETIVYTNRVNQVMLKVKRELDTNGALRQWCTYFEYDDSGRRILQAEPDAVTGFNELKPDLVGKQSSGAYIYLKRDQGLIRRTTYYASTTATDQAPGGVEGYRELETVQAGTEGTAIKVGHTAYLSSDNPSGEKVYVVGASTTYPDETNQDATKITTSYSYTWYAPAGNKPARIKEKMVTYPLVPVSQNGTGAAATSKEYYDECGNLIWSMNERGIIDQMIYDTGRNLLVERVQDVSNVPQSVGWSVTSGSHFDYRTNYQYDDLSRLKVTMGPSHEALDANGSALTLRTTDFKCYVESSVSSQQIGQPPVGDQVRSAKGYATGSSGSETFEIINPVTIVFQDNQGRVLDTVVAKRSTGTGGLNDSDTFLRADWCRWSVKHYTAKGQVDYMRDYVVIPPQSPDLGLGGVNQTPGVVGTNYNESFFGYDPETNLRVREKNASGTVTRVLYDKMDRQVAAYIGTQDVPTGSSTTWEDWTPGADGTNLVQVSATEYDHGQAGGNSNVTKSVAMVDSNTCRETSFGYDFRDRRVWTDGEEDAYAVVAYDNMDRVVANDKHDSQASGNLIAKSETRYDSRSRVYQELVHEVDPATGSLGNVLIGNTEYDDAGNVVKAIKPGGGVVAEYGVFDNLDRNTQNQIGYDDASATNGRVIVSAATRSYDAASSVLYEYTDDLNTGATATNQTYRTNYRLNWFDGIGRPIASADYGVRASLPSRPSTVPARSDTELVASTEYDDFGEPYASVDPMGMETRREYDGLGREVKVIENYTGSGTPSSPNEDDNRVTETTYTPLGEIETLTAVMENPANNQVTTYTYGTDLVDSGIASTDLQSAIIYPGGTAGANSVRMYYNRQGQITKKIDEAGTTHEYRFDGLGRLRHDCVTAFGPNVHSQVRRLSTEYEVRGMVSCRSSCMTASPNGSCSGGGVINQVRLEYNGFGQLVTDFQSHVGAVNQVSTAKIQYGYTNGNSNHIRMTEMRYPNNALVGFRYLGSQLDPFASSMNRIGSLVLDDILFEYEYLGLSRMVKMAGDDEANHRLDLWGGTVGTYSGLDQFNRVTDQHWTDSGNTLARLQYAYDRNGVATERLDDVAFALGKNFDEYYEQDGLHRLDKMVRRSRSSPDPDDTLEWGLDPVGNWSAYKRGEGTNWVLEQTRTHNTVNEITGISEGQSQPQWPTPAYDAVGNTTSFPQVADPIKSYNATYDAWNRLCKLTEVVSSTEQRVAEYEYDARNFRIRRREYDNGGAFARCYDDYFSSQWQLLESRVTTNSTSVATKVFSQHVWHACADAYVDQLAVRYRDTDNNGTLDEVLFSLYDAKYSTVALFDSYEQPAPIIQERYAYDPYGYSYVLSADYAARLKSDFDWSIRFQGLFQDNSLGLICQRNRYNHVRLGQFLQRDPMQYVDGMSLYSAYFVISDKSDPEGLALPVLVVGACCLVDAAATGVVIIGGKQLVEWCFRMKDDSDKRKCLAKCESNFLRDDAGCETGFGNLTRRCLEKYKRNENGLRSCMGVALAVYSRCKKNAIDIYEGCVAMC